MRTLVTLIALTVVSSTCALGTQEPAGRGSGAINAGGIPLIEPAARVPAPAASGETVDGGRVDLDDFAGMPVLVNFWASWCPPCVAEMPGLVEIAAEYDGRVALVGVNVKDTRANARSFERDLQVTYPSLFDPSAAIAGRFGGIAPEALPSTILLDAEHRVAIKLFGAVTASQVRRYLEQLLDETA